MERWIKCKNCGHEFSNKLSKCPECGKAHLTVKGLISAISIFAIIVVSVIGLVLGFSEKGSAIPTSSQTQSKDENMDNKTQNSNKEDAESKNSLTSDWKGAVSDIISSQESKIDTTSSKEQSTSSSQSSFTSKENSSDQSVIVEEKNYDTGLTIGIGVRYVTIPKYYLDYMYLIAKQVDSNLSFDDFAYTLTSEHEQLGVSKLIKNSNGAVTLYFSNEKYKSATQDMIIALNKISSTLEKFDFVEEVDVNQDFDSYDIKLNVDDLGNEQQVYILTVGLSSLEYQYYRHDSKNEVTINLTFKGGNTETLKVGETIQQAMDELL